MNKIPSASSILIFFYFKFQVAMAMDSPDTDMVVLLVIMVATMVVYCIKPNGIGATVHQNSKLY